MEEKRSRFEELCLPHLDAAYNLAYSLVGRDHDAQDIVQEAYIRALKGFKGLRGDNARHWLMMIVRNTAYTWLKMHANERNIFPFDPAIHATTTSKSRSESSWEERVQQLQEALPIEFREILVLRDIEGWSYKQLASALHTRQRLRQEVARVQDKESRNEL